MRSAFAAKNVLLPQLQLRDVQIKGIWDLPGNRCRHGGEHLRYASFWDDGIVGLLHWGSAVQA